MNSSTASLVLESTLTLIVGAWVLLNYSAFNQIVNAVGSTSVVATKSLWARGATGK